MGSALGQSFTNSPQNRWDSGFECRLFWLNLSLITTNPTPSKRHSAVYCGGKNVTMVRDCRARHLMRKMIGKTSVWRLQTGDRKKMLFSSCVSHRRRRPRPPVGVDGCFLIKSERFFSFASPGGLGKENSFTGPADHDGLILLSAIAHDSTLAWKWE